MHTQPLKQREDILQLTLTPCQIVWRERRKSTFPLQNRKWESFTADDVARALGANHPHSAGYTGPCCRCMFSKLVQASF